MDQCNNSKVTSNFTVLKTSTVFGLSQLHNACCIAGNHQLGDFLFCCRKAKNKKTCDWLHFFVSSDPVFLT